MGLCGLCDKNLRKFTTNTDWKNRDMHKTCWKIQQEEQCRKFTFANYVKG